METVLSLKSQLKRINFYVDNLKKQAPDELERELRMIYLKSLAKKLDASVIKNDITVQEIIDEVNLVRAKRNENKNGF